MWQRRRGAEVTSLTPVWPSWILISDTSGLTTILDSSWFWGFFLPLLELLRPARRWWRLVLLTFGAHSQDVEGGEAQHPLAPPLPPERDRMERTCTGAREFVFLPLFRAVVVIKLVRRSVTSSLSFVDPFMIRSEQLSRCACEHQRIKDELYRVLIGRVRQLGFLSRFSGVPSPHWVCVHSSSSSSCCSWTFPPSGCSQLTMWDGLWHFRALARREAAAALE